MYSIFISYRHADTADKAEHLFSLLEGDGYAGLVSFDRENLDGRFDLEILRRLDDCTDFIIVLGYHTLEGLDMEQSAWYDRLANCSIDEFPAIETEMTNAGLRLDFVRFEIARALAKGKHVMPVVPVKTAFYNFDELSLPPDIALLTKWQAEKYQDSKDFLFKDILPKITRRLVTRRAKRNWLKPLVCAGLLMLVVFGGITYVRWKMLANHETLKGNGYTEINDALNTECGDSVKVRWSDECSLEQIRVLKNLINNMIFVPKGEFVMGTDDPVGMEGTPRLVKVENDYYIGKFEVSEREWNVVMYDEAKGDETLPMANVSWNDCYDFIRKLQHLTGSLVFAMPTQVQWEYAARFGEEPHWRFAGGNDPERVAYFEKNSEGKLNGCSKMPNALELYNMSGNVAEWCSDGNHDAPKQIVRGGAYDSDETEITTTYADPVSVDIRMPQNGLRLVLMKSKK